MNRVELEGFAGMDPESKQVNANAKLAKFTLATTEGYKKDGEWQNKTSWHQILAWNKAHDSAMELVQKGKKIRVIGKINYGSYENKEGVTIKTCEIVALEITEAAPR